SRLTPPYDIKYYFGEKLDTEVNTANGLNVDQYKTKPLKDLTGGSDKHYAVLSTLKNNVVKSGCVNPICVPTSKDDYLNDTCIVATYVKYQATNKLSVEIGKTKIDDTGCRTDITQPKGTLCSHYYAQTCTGENKFGGALICKSKTKPNSWMLAGLTRDDGVLTKCDRQISVYYWDTIEIMKFVKS
ncbi:hypothetical protein Ahia01_000545400, partial [Argonauta hians]